MNAEHWESNSREQNNGVTMLDKNCHGFIMQSKGSSHSARSSDESRILLWEILIFIPARFLALLWHLSPPWYTAPFSSFIYRFDFMFFKYVYALLGSLFNLKFSKEAEMISFCNENFNFYLAYIHARLYILFTHNLFSIRTMIKLY